MAREQFRESQSVVNVSVNEDANSLGAGADAAEPSEPVDPEVMATRAKIFKIILVVLALVCSIMVIFILAKSSQYFSFLFSLGYEISAKTYLSQNYTAFMASIYISIFGFVLVTANTVLFFYRFTQKDKLLYIHIVYFLTFFISSLVALASKSYKDHMDAISSLSFIAPQCTANGYLNECLLTGSYFSYRGNYTSFFAVFTIFFVLYVVVYHYAVVKVLPFVVEPKKLDSQQEQRRSSILNANKKNETLVSQMFDQYLN